MTLKILFYSLLALLLAAIAWSQRDSDLVHGLLGSPPSPTARIRFDNGSVRDLAASEPASASDKPITLSGVRKCARGSVVVYTDKTCPPGSKELAIGGTVNVVDGQAGRPAPEPRARGKSAAEHGAEPSLRDKYMEAVINR